MTSGWPPIAGTFGSVTPAKSGSLVVWLAPDVAVRHPPLLVARVHVVRGDAAEFLRLEDRDAADRVSAPASLREPPPRARRPTRPAPDSPAAARSAPGLPQLLCGDVYASSEHGSFLTSMVLMPLCAADVEHAGLGVGRRAAVDVHAAARAGSVPRAAVLRSGRSSPCRRRATAGMKYGPMRHFFASLSAESLMAGV